MDRKLKKWIGFRKKRMSLYDGQTFSDAFKNNIKLKPKRKKCINIKIDQITNCLKNAKTGKEVETYVEKINITSNIQKQLNKEGWKFNWKKDNGKEKYAVKIKGSNKIEGLISIDKEDGYIYVNLVESSPSNMGKARKYYGVGLHLFAIACKRSIDEGFEGFVCFDAKTNLINHYKKSLNAILISSQRMIITTENAKILVDKYYKGDTKNV